MKKPTKFINYDNIDDFDSIAAAPFYTKKSWIFIRPYLMSLGNQFLTWTYSGRNQRVTVWSCFFFVVIGNALMLNLLVAIYGGIFNEIVQKADIEWKTGTCLSQKRKSRNAKEYMIGSKKNSRLSKSRES